MTRGADIHQDDFYQEVARKAKEEKAKQVKLTEDLMSMLASIRTLYEQATWNHPDDDVRVLALDVSEALILRARKELYG